MVAASTPAETTFTGKVTTSTAVEATVPTTQPPRSTGRKAARRMRMHGATIAGQTLQINHLSDEKKSHIRSLALIAWLGLLLARRDAEPGQLWPPVSVTHSSTGAAGPGCSSHLAPGTERTGFRLRDALVERDPFGDGRRNGGEIGLGHGVRASAAVEQHMAVVAARGNGSPAPAATACRRSCCRCRRPARWRGSGAAPRRRGDRPSVAPFDMPVA